MNKPTLTVDIECYANYFLVMFRRKDDGVSYAFEMFEGQPLNIRQISRIARTYRLVTFNGAGYDMPMLAYALNGATCQQLKDASDQIIERDLKPWDFERAYGCRVPDEVDHIDVMNVAPGQGSLKMYAGRMHAPELEDLPFDPSALIMPAQRAPLRLYCGKDLFNTQALFDKLAQQIELRESMSEEYGQDLRSKSDAQIAEAVIRAQVSDLLGEKVMRPYVEAGTTFKYQPPTWMSFSSPVMREAFATVCAADYVVMPTGKVKIPKEVMSMKIAHGGGVYRMGNGGLHSSEKSTAHFADARTSLVDRDVASYYPAIILNCNLKPEHLGDHFTTVYRRLVETRLEAKAKGQSCEAAGDTVGATKWKTIAESLKIVINGSFGKLGSKWSSLYAPNLMIQVTLTGQLALLMFIEAIEAAGIQVVSANTDGIVMKCPKHLEAALAKVVAKWEKVTGFQTEETRYAALFSRDVNNYIAIKPDGKVKTKGAYAPAGLQKNPTNVICVDAVTAFLIARKPIEETILTSRDITKFTTLRKVNGGAVQGDEFLGKTIRWYYATDRPGTFSYKTSGNKVPRTDGAMPLLDLPAEFPTNVDMRWYVDEAYELLMDIGHTVRPPKLTAKRRKELEAEQKAEEEEANG